MQKFAQRQGSARNFLLCKCRRILTIEAVWRPGRGASALPCVSAVRTRVFVLLSTFGRSARRHSSAPSQGYRESGTSDSSRAPLLLSSRALLLLSSRAPTRDLPSATQSRYPGIPWASPRRYRGTPAGTDSRLHNRYSPRQLFNSLCLWIDSECFGSIYSDNQ